ncbi:unnamed protein product [Paramecium sonneborni]|uniref:Tetratricopeptide repeat protein n=1 Tax=Paramecium sonneborni TaxID=65129 RepID=A0A8S1MHB3_9CILI|nr:unnamed protein product [Paramecium sonneborni]
MSQLQLLQFFFKLQLLLLVITCQSQKRLQKIQESDFYYQLRIKIKKQRNIKEQSLVRILVNRQSKHILIFKIYDLIINKKYQELNQKHLSCLRELFISGQQCQIKFVLSQQKKNGISLNLHLNRQQNNKQSLENFVNAPQKKLKVETNIKSMKITDQHLLVKEADKLYQQQNYKKALKLYNKALKINNECANIFYMKGKTLIRLNHHKRALTFINKAIKLKSDCSQYLQTKSFALFMLKNLKKSLKFCEKAIELKPENGYLYYSKAKILIKMNSQQQAVESLQLATQKDPNQFQNWLEQGKIFIELKRYEQALVCLNKAIEIKPDNEFLYFLKSHPLFKLQKYYESLKCIDLSLKLKPNFIKFEKAKAFILTKLNRVSEARYFDQCIIKIIKNYR